MSDATHNDPSPERETETSRELLTTTTEPSLPASSSGRTELIGGRGPRRSLFERLPWEKALIWGLISLAVYTMRGFFFTIFMTFMVSYVIRSIVVRVQGLISPYRERTWLERTLTLGCFALLLFAFFEAGRYIGPKLQEQGEGLYARVSQLDFEKEYTSVLESTVGRILFEQHYGDEDDERYQTAFKEFQEKGLRSVDYENFGKFRESIEAPFDAKIRDDARAKIESEIASGVIPEQEYEAWFRERKAPQILQEDEETWKTKWREKYRDAEVLGAATPLEILEKEPNFPKIRRGGMINLVTAEWAEDKEKTRAARQEWTEYLIEVEVIFDKSAPQTEEKRRAYYERLRKEEPERIQYDYDTYVNLCKAHEEGKEAFSRLLQSIDNLTETVTEDELLRKQHEDFRKEKRVALTAEWQKGETFGRIKDYLKDNLGGVIEGVEDWLKSTFKQVIALPAQVALVVLLSLFITLDFHKLRAGLHKLETSRARNFYMEIAPGLINFGRLIGRAFLAQGVIALFNTMLTFLAIKALGIQNEYFLCTVVFLCSFIPVAGVVLSSAPIAIMAMIQPDGSFGLAVYAIIAILVIHFIETSVLNPKILGDMLHLHPVLVLTVLAIGQRFFGVWGLLLAVPVAVYIIRFVILNEGIPGLIEIEPASRGRPYGPAGAVGAVPEVFASTESDHGAVPDPTGTGGSAAGARRFESRDREDGDPDSDPVTVSADAPKKEDR